MYTARVLPALLLAGTCFLALPLPAATRGGDADEGFVPIFDGKTLTGWDGDPKFWRVENGVIVGQTTKENPAPRNTFLIWRKGKPADFELKAEFRMPNEGFANSGIQIRSWEGPAKWQVSGYQPDMDWENNYTGIIYGENFRGILAGRGEKVVIGKGHKRTVERFADGKQLASFIKKRGWNEYHITARGNHISQEINGHLMCDLTDEDKVARPDGILALQIHAGPPMRVEYRNVRLKTLSAPAPAPAPAPATPRMMGEVILRRIVLIAGHPSHGYGEHEHNAGCELLAACLNQSGLPVEAVVCKNGWPKDAKALDRAATIVIFSDGGDGQPAMRHLDELAKLVKSGVGLACIHYAVEVPKGPAGDDFKNWIGGYFETFWSVNPMWKAEFKQFPHHPVANGLKPFAIDDEWYYHMRFADEMKGVTPILTAVPPDSTRREGNDAHGANQYVRARKGMAEDVAWAYQRPGGGRGFGFTGGHYHWNWANDNFRTVVLNGIVWTARLDVPPGGVPSKAPGYDELMKNLDKPQPPHFNAKHVQALLEQWRAQK